MTTPPLPRTVAAAALAGAFALAAILSGCTTTTSRGGYDYTYTTGSGVQSNDHTQPIPSAMPSPPPTKVAPPSNSPHSDATGHAPSLPDTPAGSATASPPAAALARADWSTVTARPADGRVPHHPTYVADPCLGADASDAVVSAPTVPGRMAAALDGNDAGNWNGENAKALALAPLKFAADLVTLPIHAVQTPPWSTVHSPAQPTASD